MINSLRRAIGLVAVVGLIAGACSGDADDATTTLQTLTTTSSTSTTTTTSSTTTTAPAETTTTVAETTTTMAAETTTTTTAIGTPLALSDEGVQAGETWVPLGTVEDDAIAAVSVAFGAPTDDSGWVDAFSVYGTCPGPVVRGVHWGGFVMLFTQAETDFWTEGVPHFFAYYYTAAPPDLATTEGLVLGDTLATVEALYGGPKLEIAEDPFNPTAGIWLYDLVGWTGMYGYADSQDPSGIISTINGGRGCGE